MSEENGEKKKKHVGDGLVEQLDVITPLIVFAFELFGFHTFRVTDRNHVPDGWMYRRPDMPYIKSVFTPYEEEFKFTAKSIFRHLIGLNKIARNVHYYNGCVVFQVSGKRAKWAEYILCSDSVGTLIQSRFIEPRNLAWGENRAAHGTPRTWAQQKKDRDESHHDYFSFWNHIKSIWTRETSSMVYMAQYTSKEVENQELKHGATRYRWAPLPTHRMHDREKYAEVIKNLTGGSGNGSAPINKNDPREAGARKRAGGRKVRRADKRYQDLMDTWAYSRRKEAERRGEIPKKNGRG